ncbi:uncharacterized protein JN550_004264 [Neoarthrinium moseri]|uniref:uncharacterized protein n=1 Tax=Neoarthrinium moseri TaxID=1658444 RepID=UPI001FDC3A80|nr:uncharacterized protein JN550_004264 [Neoarthrinium moseri]KAI1872061.1 hypothetical protein JN550_004264 [Neoarthrinium moseri]
MLAASEALTPAQKEHFLQHGWLKLTNCFTAEAAAEKTKDVWTRLGMSADDKNTWTQNKIHMPSHWSFDSAEFAPRAWAAICELCGGEDRINPASRQWRDSFIVNLGMPEAAGRVVPPRELTEWHVDGDFFVHYLDSPEQALLVIPLFTDIRPGGGGTMICPDGIPRVANYLYDHPEGVSPMMRTRASADFSVVDYKRKDDNQWFNELAKRSKTFVEVTGSVGDVFLLHPLMLHSATNNALRDVRIITNPPVSLREPHCFDRPDGNYSLVEQTTMQSVGGEDRFRGWKITQPREAIRPRMWDDKERMKLDEIKRIEEARKITAY